MKMIANVHEIAMFKMSTNYTGEKEA